MKMNGKELTSENVEEFIESMDTFIFDCDGVLWRTNGTIPGANETLEYLRKKNKRIFFVTNNSTKSRKEYVKKFQSLGMTVSYEEIFCSAYAAAAYLTKIQFDKKVFVVGESGIIDELTEHNIPCYGKEFNVPFEWTFNDVENMDIDPEVGAVLVGFDRQVNYYKVSHAVLTLQTNPGCRYIATNLDVSVPGLNNRNYPGGGTTAAPITLAYGKEPFVVGKPSSFMLDLILSKHHVDPSRACMIGDRLETDILFGQGVGLKTLLVFSGITTPSYYSSEENNIHSDYCASSVAVLSQASTNNNQ